MTVPLTPQHYRLTIEPDLERFTFDGRMILRATANQPTDTVDLDCKELAVWGCRIKPDGSGADLSDCPFTLDPAEERLRIHPPSTLSGPFEITIDYTGKINDRMAGFYRSRIKTDTGPDHIAVTQFQESDARRAFPCLDHPARKAVFTVEMVVDKNLTAISNTDIRTITDLDDGTTAGHLRPDPEDVHLPAVFRCGAV